MIERAPASPKLRIDVLGDLTVRIDEAEIALRAPMHRALLVLLAIEANRPVSTERLIDELWGTDPPSGARGTLQSYVSVLRRKFRDAGLGDGEALATQTPGYVLRLDEPECDVLEFRGYLRAARDALAVSDGASDAAGLLDLALGVLGDPVLPDLDHLASVRTFVTDIEERRTWAIEQKVELDLQAGRASDIVPLLNELVKRRPLDERMTGLQMRALYQSGRQADALGAYQDLRQRLVEQLGIEPSPEPQAIERSILQAEVEAEQAPGAPARSRRPAPVPHPTTSLIGRGSEIRELSSALHDRRLVTVTGPGGCGKTRLAVETALTLTADFDQAVWIELNAVEPGGSVTQAVASGLGMVPRQQDGLLEVVADELGESNTLLVLDNCEHLVGDAALLVEELLALCGQLTVLSTSREALMVGGEYTLALAPLSFASPLELTRARHESASDAALMFIDRAGLGRSRGVDLALIEGVCAQLDGIPLAIELAAPLLSTMTLDEMADGLLDRFRLLASERRTAREQHRTLRAVVEWSYDLLDESERRTLEALSVFQGPFTMAAASEVADAVGARLTSSFPDWSANPSCSQIPRERTPATA